MTNGLLELAKALPKTDLHVHFEGLITRQTYCELVEAGDEDQANYIFKEEYDGLADFIESIRLANGVIRTAEQCASIVRSYLEDAASLNVRHVELSVEPSFHRARGLPTGALFEGIISSLLAAERDLGISSCLIMSVARDLPAAEAFRDLQDAEAAGVRLAAVGLAGQEHSQPLTAFQDFLNRAADRGYRVVAHAGEKSAPSEIWSAMQCFPLARIDHGCAATSDPALTKVLREAQLPLAMAPISNDCTGASKNGAAAAALLREGVCVSINSDDPGIQQSSLLGDFQMLIERQDLDRDEIIQLTVNGFRSSFLENEDQDRYVEEIHSIAASQIQPQEFFYR